MATAGLANVIGAVFIGGMITLILYGITTLQTYLYFMNYASDGMLTKLLVATIWILDTLHISLMCHALYYYLVSNYSVPSALVDGVWSLFATSAVNLCIVCSVQAFFTVKIFYLCRRHLRWLVTTPIVVTILADLGFGIETIAFTFIKKQLSSLSQISLYSLTPFSGAVVISDVFIMIALCALMREQSSRTVFPRTKRLVNTLVIYAINRCLLTSLVSIAEVIVFSIDTNSWWFIAIEFTLGKLYANSLLASLNTRNYLRGHGSNDARRGNVNIIHLSNLPDLSPPGELDTPRGGSDKSHPRSRDALDV